MVEPDHVHRWSILGETLSHAMFGSSTVDISPVSMRRSSRYIDEGTVRNHCGWRVASWRTYLEPRLMVEWVSTVDESVADRLSRVTLPQVMSNNQVRVYSNASISQGGGISPGSVPWVEPYESVFHCRALEDSMTLNFYVDDAVLVSGAASAAGLCPVRRLLELSAR